MSYVIAVRELCAFTAKQGDLDLRFTPSPTALEGITGHQVVQSRRIAATTASGDDAKSRYEIEVSLSGQYQELQVRGRADGYDPHRLQLEEIKSYRGDLDRIPANHRYLHWAQLKVYGYLLCEKRNLEEVHLALVYFDIGTHQETVIAERYTKSALKIFFEEQCERFLNWARQELAYKEERNRALTDLAFPYKEFRTGQRQLAEAVYRSAGTKRPLLAQAPTGIGKTVGTIFPILKAYAHKKLDKVFFLAAKTPGRQVAIDALAIINQGQHKPLRIIELVARDKACEHPDKACNGESCPLAKGFYDRLPQARSAAVRLAALDRGDSQDSCTTKYVGREAIRTLALEHDICPYYLAQDMVRWADVVVADYNYYFDASGMLYALTMENNWQIGVLVDEAHNLISRARDMYSAALHQPLLKSLRKVAPRAVRKELDKVHRCWNELNKAQEENYTVYAEVPAKLLGALRQSASVISEYFAQYPDNPDALLQEYYFDVLQFTRLVDTFDDHSLFDIEKDAQGGASSLCIRNVMPAPHLTARFEKPFCTVLFSAPLSPWHYYSEMLGLVDPVWIDVDSPFQAEQLKVHVAKHISTRYQDRAASVPLLVDLMVKQYASRPGNYLAFFSSFAYLDQVHALLAATGIDIPLWRQSARMSETDKALFLSRFEPQGKGIGFAVLGGAFSEGIDLPGERLIGAFIATLGLPQVNPVNQQMMQRIEQKLGNGYDYIYQYPGLQKVVQAAGRVIRTTDDYGTVHLMDDRFGNKRVCEHLPKWWKV